MPVTTRITTFFGSRIPQPLNRFQVLSFHRACLMNFCPYSGRDEDTTYSQLAVGCTWDRWYVLRHSQPKWHCWFVFKKTFCDYVDLVPESELKHSAKELFQCWVLSIFLMIADMKPSSSYIHTHPPCFDTVLSQHCFFWRFKLHPNKSLKAPRLECGDAEVIVSGWIIVGFLICVSEDFP